MKWKYLGAACVFVGYLMHSMGAPVYAILVGIALVIGWKALAKERRPYEKT